MSEPEHHDLRTPDQSPETAPLRYAHLSESDMVAIIAERWHELERAHFRARLILEEVEQLGSDAAARQRVEVAEYERRLRIYAAKAAPPEQTEQTEQPASGERSTPEPEPEQQPAPVEVPTVGPTEPYRPSRALVPSTNGKQPTAP